MRLLSLQLEQFRNYPSLELDFSASNVHVLVGPNGAGKTNILEAISVLSLTKSCESAQEDDIVQWGADFYRVCGQALRDDNEDCTLEVTSVVRPRKQKGCFCNDVRQTVAQMVGQLPVVIFLPQELDLFTGSPSQRRGFLDRLLCQVSPEFVQLSSTYTKLLKQRNALLRRIGDGTGRRGDLFTWNVQLAEVGSGLMAKRLELVEVLQCTLGEELKALGEEWEAPQIVYVTKVQSRDPKEMQGELLHLLDHYEERDIVTHGTTVGPHRDDWRLEVDNRDIATFASRGQQRTAVLALLFLAVSFLELRRGEKPLVLLDDVFSELDDAHQTALLRSFDDHQVVITTTHLPSELHGAQVWEVEKGVVGAGVGSAE